MVGQGDAVCRVSSPRGKVKPRKGQDAAGGKQARLVNYTLFFFFNLFIFIYLWLCWVFVSVRGLSLVVASGCHSSLRCVGLLPLRPLVAEHRLQTCRLSNCGSRAQLLRGMWDPFRPGLEPVSPALAGRLSTTEPPGKPKLYSWEKKKLDLYFMALKK